MQWQGTAELRKGISFMIDHIICHGGDHHLALLGNLGKLPCVLPLAAVDALEEALFDLTF